MQTDESGPLDLAGVSEMESGNEKYSVSGWQKSPLKKWTLGGMAKAEGVGGEAIVSRRRGAWIKTVRVRMELAGICKRLLLENEAIEVERMPRCLWTDERRKGNTSYVFSYPWDMVVVGG